MSIVPSDFQFSQASLQDYVDCRRRFQLRYLMELVWPAIQADPAEEQERHSRLGVLFHRLLHQHQLGIPPERLAGAAQAIDREMGDSRLSVWWDSYLRAGPQGLPDRRDAEVALSAPIAGSRLYGKYDLIASEPGRRAVIVDWKTSRSRPARPWLASRLQTRVYRCVLVESGAVLNEGRTWQPDQVEMIYWFANHPDRPEHLRYSDREYRADREVLGALISEIVHAGEADFSLTEDVRRCLLCPYRSLCERGVEAGRTDAGGAEETLEADEATTSWESGFDFEQVAEIAY